MARKKQENNINYRKGGIYYFPPELNFEIELIRKSEDIKSRAEACRKAAKYTQLGREAMRAGINPSIPKIDLSLNDKKRKKTEEEWYI